MEAQRQDEDRVTLRISLLSLNITNILRLDFRLN
jgi:hypothetical protein